MTVKVDIISGFLGAGKTTFINKLLESKVRFEKIAIIENEYGKVGIDGDILRKDNISVRDITSGCICCSLAEDLDKALEEIYYTYNPHRIIIEPTGIGKLSDIVRACQNTRVKEQLQINSLITIVNTIKFEMLNSGFGDFFHNQIQNADTILLSRLEKAESDTVETVIEEIRKLNPNARIISTPWENIDVVSLLTKEPAKKEHTCGCNCGCGKSHSHNDDIDFDSWGTETDKEFDETRLLERLNTLNQYGDIVRGKGVLKLTSQKWIQFDYAQGELNIKHTQEAAVGKVSFIGRELSSEDLSVFFS